MFSASSPSCSSFASTAPAGYSRASAHQRRVPRPTPTAPSPRLDVRSPNWMMPPLPHAGARLDLLPAKRAARQPHPGRRRPPGLPHLARPPGQALAGGLRLGAARLDARARAAATGGPVLKVPEVIQHSQTLLLRRKYLLDVCRFHSHMLMQVRDHVGKAVGLQCIKCMYRRALSLTLRRNSADRSRTSSGRSLGPTTYHS